MSTHHGSCHCGQVQFDVEMELENLLTCNCSICGRTGAIMAFVPAAKMSNVVGQETMTDYVFNKKRIHHTFCSVCGVRPFGHSKGEDGSDWAMINVRCLDGVDVHTLKIARQYDGKNL